MSGNVPTLGHLAQRGQATKNCQGMSKHFDIWQTGAELPINVREFLNIRGRATSKCQGMSKIWTFGGQGPSYQ